MTKDQCRVGIRLVLIVLVIAIGWLLMIHEADQIDQYIWRMIRDAGG